MMGATIFTREDLTGQEFYNTSETNSSSEIGTMLCDWAVGQAGASYYSGAALSANDSKTR